MILRIRMHSWRQLRPRRRLHIIINKLIILVIINLIFVFLYYFHCIKNIQSIINTSLNIFKIDFIAKLFIKFLYLIRNHSSSRQFLFPDTNQHRSTQKHKFFIFFLAIFRKCLILVQGYLITETNLLFATFYWSLWLHSYVFGIMPPFSIYYQMLFTKIYKLVIKTNAISAII